MARASGSPRPAAAIRGGGIVAVAIMVMNLTTYGFTIASAHILGPTGYGALAAWMNLLLVVNVGALGLQATAARRLSSGEHRLQDVEPHLVRLTLITALALGGVLLALTPVINVTLQLHDWVMAAMLAVTVVPLTIVGGLGGILQGERRWGALSAVYICVGVPRLVLGVAFTLWRPDPRSTAIAVAVAMLAPVAVCLRALHLPRRRPRAQRAGLGSLVREMGHNSQALLAFFAVSNVDLIVARHTLSSHDAGLYAAGLILAKAVLFLPQFVAIVAFPSMASSDSSRTFVAAVLSVAALGALATVGTALLPGLALIFVGGSAYDGVSSQLWLFAVLGTLLACLMMVVYALIARAGQRSVYLTWLGLVAIIGLGLTAHTILGLLLVVLGVDAALVLVLLVAYLRTSQPAAWSVTEPAVEGYPAQ